MSLFVQQNSSVSDFSVSESWVILSPIEQSIKRKIEAVGIPLKDWNISINYGIKTGFNEAFIINKEKREEILSNCQTEEERKKTDELIRPILRGRDIKRYGYEYADLYLIATFPSRHYDIEQYPAVKNHLLSFGMERLEQTGKEYVINGKKVKARKKTNNKWFETQDSINYWEEFNKPKVMYAEIMRITKSNVEDFPRFSLVEPGIFSNNSVHFFSGKNLNILVCLLNSEYATWWFFNTVSVLDAGGMQMRKIFVENIPLPYFTKNITPYNVDKEIYKTFNFSNEEILFIRETIKNKQEEVLNTIK